MASSFSIQIAPILHILKNLNPKYVLDIGKGFGKYGFLIHEYFGISNTKRIDPTKTMKDQSDIVIDAIEIDPDLILPHLDHFYQQVFFGDVLKLYTQLPTYDVIIMIDIVEHISKVEAIEMIKYFLERGSMILIATPIHFFQQELYESVHEHHISHWTAKDFSHLGFLNQQYFDAGAIYLLSKSKVNIRGFGNTWVKKIRRVARAIRNEV